MNSETDAISLTTNSQKRSWQRELLRILLQNKLLMSIVIILSIISPIVEPVQAFMAKNILDRLTAKNAVFLRHNIAGFIPLIARIFIILTAIRLINHLADKIVDARLKIAFQQFYFDRQLRQNAGEDVSRTINDCEQARKIVDVIQKDIWVVIIGLPSVLIWQMRLAAEWVLPLVFSAVPALCFTFLFGPSIRRWSRRRLESLASISRAVCDTNRYNLCTGQKDFYRSSVLFELYKKSAEIFGELMLWFGLAVLLFFARFIPILPETISAGDFASFIINLKLISKPLHEMGKIYVKIHESYPAVLRVFG